MNVVTEVDLQFQTVSIVVNKNQFKMVQFEKRINVNFFCRQLLLTGSSWLKISKLYYIRLDVCYVCQKWCNIIDTTLTCSSAEITIDLIYTRHLIQVNESAMLHDVEWETRNQLDLLSSLIKTKCCTHTHIHIHYVSSNQLKLTNESVDSKKNIYIIFIKSHIKWEKSDSLSKSRQMISLSSRKRERDREKK